MSIREVLQQAVASLIAHRFRASLTMLGIAWGIVTVVILMAYGNGFERAILRGFSNAFLSGTVLVSGGATSEQAGGERAGQRVQFKEADFAALRELGSLKYVSPEIMRGLPVSYGTRATTAGVRGVAPEYGIMRSERPGAGRFVNADDVELDRRVAFLGTDVARKLFGNLPPVGQTVRINGLSFEVIGVLAHKVQISNYFYPDQESVFIPYSVARIVWAPEYVDNFVFQPLSPAFRVQAIRQVREVLATRHHFSASDLRAARVREADEVMGSITGIALGLQVVLVFIGTLTLMIGGVGVMNIMLVSVTERTREIGVRKALGAKRRQILWQFLLEALAITFAGGVLGMLLSALLVRAIGVMPFLGALMNDPGGETDIHLLVSLDVLLAAAGVLIVAGVLSGMWPALRASRLDPVESLRFE